MNAILRSLPPTSVNMLSLLIQSKVRLPRYPSKDIDHKRELRHSNEREFFLEIVKDISNDLDLKSLSQKMVMNMSCCADAEKASLFLVSWDTFSDFLYYCLSKIIWIYPWKWRKTYDLDLKSLNQKKVMHFAVARMLRKLVFI